MRELHDEATPGPQIEDLLIAGLDRYFAGRHDEAIHIWTRVLFIDRGHRRARAYIERARSLLSRSIRDAGPDDRALAALAHLDRLEHAGSAAPARAGAPASRGVPAPPSSPARIPWTALLIILGLGVGAAIVTFAAPEWWMAVRRVTSTDTPSAQALPIITTGEAALVRARALHARGHLRDAAAALDVIAADDPLRGEADRLLIQIQNALLASVTSVPSRR